MAALASPEVGLLPVDKDEECDKDSGHHSGEEMDCVINPENQVRRVNTIILGLSQKDFLKIRLKAGLNKSRRLNLLSYH